MYVRTPVSQILQICKSVKRWSSIIYLSLPWQSCDMVEIFPDLPFWYLSQFLWGYLGGLTFVRKKCFLKASLIEKCRSYFSCFKYLRNMRVMRRTGKSLWLMKILLWDIWSCCLRSTSIQRPSPCWLGWLTPTKTTGSPLRSSWSWRGDCAILMFDTNGGGSLILCKHILISF